MRRVFLQMMVSVDGYFEGPKRELNWHVWDDEMESYGRDMLDSIDGILLGRVTYQLFADYWPTATDSITARMNELQKIVFSRTLDKAEWKNTRLVKSDAAGEILKLKRQPGNDLAIFGSSNLALSLMPSGLVDEFRIIVNPIVLGAGKPLFEGMNSKMNLRLAKTRTFGSGNVMLHYEPVR